MNKILTDKDILQRARRMGIQELNAMQRAVSSLRAPAMILLAPTGSGKTLAFSIAVLKRLKHAGTGVQTVIMAPSRELAMQINNVLRPLAAGYKTLCMYGGNAFSAEEASIRGAVPDIVIATPGRLLDHVNRKTLDISSAHTLVVDEYDKTLELGFHEDVRRITRRLTKLTFSALTSATRLDDMPPFIKADRAEVIDALNDSKPSIMVMEVPSATRDKLDTLAALVRHINAPTMVFVNHRDAVDRVVKSLRSRGVTAMAYHGGMEQRDREIAVAAFRSGAAPILVATDLAARGLDISGVDSVIHYHLPVNEQAYTHRNGRTARAGAEGNVYVITGPDEVTADYIVTHHPFYPDMTAIEQVVAPWTMLYINAGKREKISKGDVAGYMMKQCGISAADVGTITIGADYALVAVRPADVKKILATAKTARLKNQRVRITEL